ncbi:MAG: serine hydrolase domain-containing protein [Bacteroidia bacterium]
MKLFPFILSLFFISINLLAAQEIDPLNRLQKILDQDVVDGQFAGGVAGLTIQGEEIVVAAGYRDIKSETPFERLTLNRIASISKSMTAVAALQLYEQGLLDLDEPIATYLPAYPKQHANRITTRHLLLHSSGIGAYQSSKETENEYEYANLTEAATVFQDRDLVDEPGNAEHYTTYGYVVLGMVIEAVSGQTYEDYMKEHIWAVAGMEHTGVEHLNESYENKSSLYRRTKRGKIRLADTNNLSNRIPGGGIYSTVDDLLKFGQAVLDHRLINETTFAMMMEEPGLAYDGNPYGMGWFLYGENPDLGQAYGHTGEQTGSAAVLLIFPEKDAVMVVMSNTAHAMNHIFGIAVVHLIPLAKEIDQK